MFITLHDESLKFTRQVYFSNISANVYLQLIILWHITGHRTTPRHHYSGKGVLVMTARDTLPWPTTHTQTPPDTRSVHIWPARGHRPIATLAETTAACEANPMRVHTCHTVASDISALPCTGTTITTITTQWGSVCVKLTRPLPLQSSHPLGWRNEIILEEKERAEIKKN